MTNQRIVTVIWNKNAVVGQPIALLVVFIIAGVILTLLFLTIPSLVKETHRQQLETEIDKIVVEASTMFEYTENGTSKAIPVKLPSSLRFLVFGSTSTQGTNEPTDLRLDERTSNNYYYVMNDGTIHLFHTTARFSNQNMTRIVIYHPGCFTITLQTRQKEGNTYVTMQ